MTTETPFTIRRTVVGDSESLRTIERLAGEQFRGVGLPSVADDEPFSVAELAEYATGGCGWAAIDDGGVPVGYAVVDRVDGYAHLEQISVRPDHQGLGLGRALIDAIHTWARVSGISAITLTSFADVAWNAPLYQHLGFRVMTDDELGPELRAVRDDEIAHGLDVATRVCMRLDVTP